MEYIKGKLDIKKSFSGIVAFFVHRRQWAIASVMLVLLIYAGYLWYTYVINPQWSEGQKQEYISTKKNEAVFNQKKFDDALSEITQRKSEYGNDPINVPDIFNLK